MSYNDKLITGARLNYFWKNLKTIFAPKATTLVGYGITDAYTKEEIDDKKYAPKSTTLAGYGITDAYTKKEVDDNRICYEYIKTVELERDTSEYVVATFDDFLLADYEWVHLYKFSEDTPSKETLVSAVIRGDVKYYDNTSADYYSSANYTITSEDLENADSGDGYIAIRIYLMCSDVADEAIYPVRSYGWLYVVYDHNACALETGIAFSSNGIYLSTSSLESHASCTTTTLTHFSYTVSGVKKIDDKYLDLLGNDDFTALMDTVNNIKAALDKLPNDGGTGTEGGVGIIDVDALPTEDINSSCFYRLHTVKGQVENVYMLFEGVVNSNRDGFLTVIIEGVVDALPEAGNPVVFNDDGYMEILPLYYLRSDNMGYMYFEGTWLDLATASEGMWGGVISSDAEVTNPDLIYIVYRLDENVEYTLYHYTDQWLEVGGAAVDETSLDDIIAEQESYIGGDV